jgi:hypothetical protein
VRGDGTFPHEAVDVVAFVDAEGERGRFCRRRRGEEQTDREDAGGGD